MERHSKESLLKLIWVEVANLYPNDICTSLEDGHLYQFFKGYKIILNTDTTISVFDTHISEYYTDKYGMKRPNKYIPVKNKEQLQTLLDKIYVEINNQQAILSSQMGGITY